MRIAGVPVQAGDLVLPDNWAASHDRAAVTDPERFEVTRPAVAHLSLGHGGRYRIGAALARLELRAVFSRLVPRFPALRLAEPVELLTFNHDTLTGGLAPRDLVTQRARTGIPLRTASRLISKDSVSARRQRLADRKVDVPERRGTPAGPGGAARAGEQLARQDPGRGESSHPGASRRD